MSQKPVIRCSSLDRLLSCPGSQTLIAKVEAESFDLGEEVGHAMTWRGNWCHWEAARRLIEEHDAWTDGPLQGPVLPKGWQPSKWEHRSVEWFLANLLAVTPEDHAFHVERALKWETPTFILTGHLDVFSVNADATEVHWNDQKTGLGEVDPADINWQIGGYGAVLKATIPTLKRGTARIFQRSADTPVSEIEIEDMDRLLPFLEQRINEALSNRYQLSTGKQCLYCDALICCPAIREELKAMKMLLTPEQVESLKVVPSLAELAEVVHRFRLIAGPGEKLVDALRERLASAPGGEVAFDNFIARVVDAPGRRKVTNTKAAFDLASTKLPEDVLWDALSMSLSDLEDLLVEHGNMKRTSKKDGVENAEGWIKQNMKHLVERATNKQLKFIAA